MMYRRMGPKELEKVIEEVKTREKMKKLLPKEFQALLLFNGKLSDHGLNSEYERGFVDCWNKLILHCS